MRTNLLNWCNLVLISKNIVFYAFLVIIYWYLVNLWTFTKKKYHTILTADIGQQMSSMSNKSTMYQKKMKFWLGYFDIDQLETVILNGVNCLSNSVLFAENLQIAAKVVLDESVKCVEQEFFDARKKIYKKTRFLQILAEKTCQITTCNFRSLPRLCSTSLSNA